MCALCSQEFTTHYGSIPGCIKKIIHTCHSGGPNVIAIICCYILLFIDN